MRSKAKVATFVIGNLLLVAGVLWCLAGAGIYGSPLAAFGSESWWILAYIFAVAVLPGIASWLVFHATSTARLLLRVGAVLGCILIREQANPGWLTAFPESHQSPRDIDWSQFE